MELHLGSNIRSIRKLRGYPEKYLAAELDITIGAYSKLERKEDLPFRYIMEIADILEVPYQQIIEFEAPPRPQKKERSDRKD